MRVELPEKAKNALVWIGGIFARRGVPFQIAGGLAAKLYGSPRPLNDIDIDIAREDFARIAGDIKAHIVRGPADYRDEKWDLYMATLSYKGQEIDIGSLDWKIYDEAAKTWRSFLSDPGKAVAIRVAGLTVPVMPKAELIAYKKYLNGEHQKIDIEAIS